MKYLTIICMLVASCSSVKKAVNQQKQEANKSSYSLKDSAGSLSIDTSSEKGSIEWITTTIDSGFDKVTEEEIKEVIDSNIIHRITKRTIKEKGQKRVEQSSATIQVDSSGKHVREQAIVKQLQRQDSSAVTVTKDKAVKRITFLPWWIWLIVAVVGGLVVWKRNSIIDLFT